MRHQLLRTVGEPGVGIVDDAAFLVSADVQTIYSPFQWCTPVDQVGVGCFRNAMQRDCRSDVQYGAIWVFASPTPRHGLVAQVVNTVANALHVHLQFVLRASFITQMQSRQFYTRIPEYAKVGCEGDTRQILGQIRFVPLPVVRHVEHSVEVMPDVVLGDA